MARLQFGCVTPVAPMTWPDLYPWRRRLPIGIAFRYSRVVELTEAENWAELRANVLEAVLLHFEDATTRPRLVQMHYVKDELVPVEAA